MTVSPTATSALSELVWSDAFVSSSRLVGRVVHDHVHAVDANGHAIGTSVRFVHPLHLAVGETVTLLTPPLHPY